MAVDPWADDTDFGTEDESRTNGSGSWDSAMDEPERNARSALGDGNRVRVTLKGGRDFDAPWITVDGLDLRDALEQFEDAATVRALIDRVAKVGAYFASTSASGNSGSGSAPQRQQQGQAQGGGSGGYQQRRGRPQGATEAPNGERRYCDHGEMAWRSGISQAGKPYAGWYCPNPNRDQQCRPEYPNR